MWSIGDPRGWTIVSSRRVRSGAAAAGRRPGRAPGRADGRRRGTARRDGPGPLRTATSWSGSRTGSCSPPRRSTSSNPSRMQSAKTSGSGTAAMSMVMPTQQVPAYDSSVMFDRGADGRTERDVALDRARRRGRRGRGSPGRCWRRSRRASACCPTTPGGRRLRPAAMAFVYGRDRSSRALRQRSPISRMREAGSRIRDGDREPDERDPVAPDRVVRGPDADGHGDPQLVDGGSVTLVVSAQATGDRGHEPVVDRAARGRRGPLQIGQPHLERLEVTGLAALLHDRRERLAHWRDRASDGPHGPRRLGARSTGRGTARSAAGTAERVPDATIPNARTRSPDDALADQVDGARVAHRRDGRPRVPAPPWPSRRRAAARAACRRARPSASGAAS